ncbi:MAG: GNAT family N-acetyltransferase [Nocardioides sp.]
MPHIRIVHVDQPTHAAIAVGDLEEANRLSPVPLSPVFITESFRSTYARRATQLLEHPEDEPWVTGVIWDEDQEIAVGAAGFHGSPDETGMVEIGYSVDPAYRRRGYARAATQELLDRAIAHPDVRVLRATISPENQPSLNLIASFGLERNGEQWDEEDGLEWIFEIRTPTPDRG